MGCSRAHYRAVRENCWFRFCPIQTFECPKEPANSSREHSVMPPDPNTSREQSVMPRVRPPTPIFASRTATLTRNHIRFLRSGGPKPILPTMPLDRGTIEEQLHALGESPRWWNRRELRDLPGALNVDEVI